MIVVSDASPLTNLAVIGRLDLLRDLYARVIVPPAVAAELRTGDSIGAHTQPIAQTAWSKSPP